MRVRRTLIVTAVTIIALLALVVPGTGSAKGSKPTIVLVHGAWADGSSWAGVVRRLQRAGYTVHVPANPLRSLTADAAYIHSFLATIDGPIVLVGHSYGGSVITNAVGDNTNVKSLVYVDAFVPDQGESVLQLAAAKPGSSLGGDPATVFNAVPYPGGPGNDVDLYVKPRLFVHAFANDLPKKTAAVLASSQRGIALSALGEPSGAPAWKTLPSSYLVGTKDKVIPADGQRLMAARAHARTVEISASHLSMISHPQAVAKLIMDAASGAKK